MSGQFITYHIAQRADENTNSLVVNSDPVTDEVLGNAATYPQDADERDRCCHEAGE